MVGSDCGGDHRPPLRPPKDFGPTGHDYRMSPDAGPIAVNLSESEINAMIAARLRAKISHNFVKADEIQVQLTDVGVYVNDARKEWRADGVMFGDSANNNGRPVRERVSRRDGEMAPLDVKQSPYSAGMDIIIQEWNVKVDPFTDVNRDRRTSDVRNDSSMLRLRHIR